MNPMDMRRRTAVAYAALPMVQAGRWVELAGLPAVARIAVLVEAAGSLAAMARRQAQMSHVDPANVALLVSDPADAMAVLGRGRWLPTMQRRVLAYPKRRPRRITRPRQLTDQLTLFPTNVFRPDIESR